jgi:hypothetical protein
MSWGGGGLYVHKTHLSEEIKTMADVNHLFYAVVADKQEE